MNPVEFLATAVTPAEQLPKPRGIVRRLWDQLVEVSEVAVRHHYAAHWEQARD